MSNHRYSPEFKDEAVRQIIEAGHSVPRSATPLTTTDPGAPGQIDIPSPNAVSNKATPLDAGSIPDPLQIVQPPVAPAGSPLFCLDLLHHFNFQIAFGHQLLQSRVLFT